MGVRNNKSGKPFLELTGKAAEQLKKFDTRKYDCSH